MTENSNSLPSNSYKSLQLTLENSNGNSAIRALWEQGIVGNDYYAINGTGAYTSTGLPNKIEQGILEHSAKIVEIVSELDASYLLLKEKVDTMNEIVNSMKRNVKALELDKFQSLKEDWKKENVR